MGDWFASIGESTLQTVRNLKESFAFDITLLSHMFSPKSYNDATVGVLVRQVYYTSVQLLPFYITLSVIVGSAVVGIMVSTAMSFNLTAKIGYFIVQIILDEMAPFITVLLLALRSGAAINTEMAVMKVSGETKTLDYFGINPFVYLYLPRVLNGMISMVMLSGLFVFVALFSGYIVLVFFLKMGMTTYIMTITEAITLVDIATLVIKSMLFGYVLSSIPVYRGNKTMMTYNAIPIAVLQGMVKLFVAIIVIEVLSLVRFV
ncbi:MAG: hypothetical protein KU37_04385 [Sulfuricurvum sp. PC08-66]|nr:MAG: hypothetical protein KU37_04385 [Sulfuricurvum sp. PC08-66]